MYWFSSSIIFWTSVFRFSIGGSLLLSVVLWNPLSVKWTPESGLFRVECAQDPALSAKLNQPVSSLTSGTQKCLTHLLARRPAIPFGASWLIAGKENRR